MTVKILTLTDEESLIVLVQKDLRLGEKALRAYNALRTRIEKADVALSVLKDALNSVRPAHFLCDEDGWYSCPLSTDGCLNPATAQVCNCDAERINKAIDDAIAAAETARVG